MLITDLKKHVAQQIFELGLSDSTDLTMTSDDIARSLTLAPANTGAHYAFPCFQLAKAQKVSPAAIAQTVALKLQSKGLTQVSHQGPYLNYQVSHSEMEKFVIEPLQKDSFIKPPWSHVDQSIAIEYSQPNTHKVLHVGHMRNLCLGAAIANILKMANGNVISCTYPGDMGTHVAKTLWYILYQLTPAERLPVGNPGEWLGQIYNKAHSKLEEIEKLPEGETAKAQLSQILKDLESKSGEVYTLWQTTREWSISLMQEAYAWAGVTFDHWFFESDFDSVSLSMMQKFYQQGSLVQDQGALGMDLSAENLGFCLLVKTDGTGLYATKDIALAEKKISELGAHKNIYVVDTRQSYHFDQVFACLRKLNIAGPKDALFHLKYEMVELPDGAMSSRKGNIIPLMELIRQMQDQIKKQYLNTYSGDWTTQEIESTAHLIAQGAIKYGMTKMDNQRKIVFEMSEWLKLDGETGPYLQYTGARLQSILRKADSNDLMRPANSNYKYDQDELGILFQCSRFLEIVDNCAEQLKTLHLCSYLYDLCKMFNAYYAKTPIGKEADASARQSRLKLTQGTLSVLREGLKLLGIQIPTRM